MTKRLVKSAAALVLAVLPLSAQAVKEYQAPAGAPTANVRLINLRPDGMWMRPMTLDLAKCRKDALLPWIGGGRKLEQERVGMPDASPPRDGLAELRIQAGVPTAISAGFHAPNPAYWRKHGWDVAESYINLSPLAPRCPAPWFVPDAGADYEVVFDSRLDGCEVTVSRLRVAADGAVVREAVATPMITFPYRSKKKRDYGDCSAVPATSRH